jgi:hypothetical protein
LSSLLFFGFFFQKKIEMPVGHLYRFLGGMPGIFGWPYSVYWLDAAVLQQHWLDAAV